MTADPAPTPVPDYPRPADLELVPIELGPSRTSGRLPLGPAQTRPDGALYGGAATSAAVVAMEAATQRDILWVTTQFVSPAHVGDVIDYDVRVLAKGRRVAQLQLVARARNDLVFCALGATAVPRPGGLTGQYESMPTVASPDQSVAHLGRPDITDLPDGYHTRTEFLEAPMAPGHPPGAMAMWARLVSGSDLTPAAIAYLADIVPVAVARGAGKVGAGISLDNSMRFGPIVPTQRVLLELRGHMASGGFGHASLTAWTPDGTIVATGSQTTNMIYV